MDGTAISEQHFTRLSDVARATRQGWAADDLLASQTAPYDRAHLHEVIALRVLQERLGKTNAAVAWRQLRPGLAVACDSEVIALVVDLHLIKASWVEDDSVIVAAARAGHPIQLFDLTAELAESDIGFTLAARPRRKPPDALADRRRARSRRGA
jgi:hypothetical protein